MVDSHGKLGGVDVLESKIANNSQLSNRLREVTNSLYFHIHFLSKYMGWEIEDFTRYLNKLGFTYYYIARALPSLQQ